MPDTSRPFWNTPAVRHLHWLCHAPSLIECGPVFTPSSVLPDDINARLRDLDKHPEPLLNCLSQSASYRLGHYFESLYSFLLSEILGWQVLLRNTPVHCADGRTLGELDFIVRNGLTGGLEHHEVAVKFYLGLHRNHRTRWYGPNAQDRLDIKTQRMLTHQCRMADRSETLATLAAAGITDTVSPVLIMPGTLFSPADIGFGPTQVPAWVNPGHERGQWIRHSELFPTLTANWALLKKPDWLSRHQQLEPADSAETQNSLARIAEGNSPRLFAHMARRTDGCGYEEISRWFVVPDHWPKRYPRPDGDHHKDHPHQA